MTGDAPQPGDKPRNEGEPWSYTDPNTAWWQVETDREPTGELAGATAARPRHPRRRPAPNAPAKAVAPGGTGPAFAPEAVDAHAAGAQDAAQALDAPPAALVEAEQEERIAGAEAAAAAEAVADARTGQAEPLAVERDHDRPTRERYQPAGATGERYTGRAADGQPAADEERAAADDRAAADEERAEDDDRTAADEERAEDEDVAARAADVPDVMILPEPSHHRTRPTVALDRGSVPGQPAGGQSRLGQARTQATEGVLDPVRAERLENSPFWLSDEERAAAGSAWPVPDTRQRPADATGPDDTRIGRPPRRRPRSPRHPATGLLGLLALALIAAFFSWVSAEPFWLAVGHGDRGVATVARCTGAGVTQRCTGGFAAADGSFTVERVTLVGVEPGGRNAGAVAPARMVSPDSRQAYAGVGPLVHLRWVLGFVLVLLCGYGIAGFTGARRLGTARARRAAVLTSLAGPLVLLLGFLAAAF